MMKHKKSKNGGIKNDLYNLALKISEKALTAVVATTALAVAGHLLGGPPGAVIGAKIATLFVGGENLIA